MTTGQYPIRRETDEQAAARVDRLEARRQEYEKQGRPMMAPLRLTISAAGKLTSPWLPTRAPRTRKRGGRRW